MLTPEQMSLAPYGSEAALTGKGYVAPLKEFTLREAMRTSTFWLIYLALFLGGFATIMFSVHAIPFGESHGISEISGSEALGFYGAGSLVARIGLGLLSDRISRINGLILAFLIQLIALASLPFIGSSPILFFICALGIGFGYGGFFADFISLTGDVFGVRSIDRIWSINEMAWGFGGLLGPILAGIYFDNHSSYTGAFELAAGGSAFAIVLIILLAKRIQLMQSSFSTAVTS